MREGPNEQWQDDQLITIRVRKCKGSAGEWGQRSGGPCTAMRSAMPVDISIITPSIK